MDKKGTARREPSAKGLVADSKKPQDGAVSKQWPKGGRRREPPAGGTYASPRADCGGARRPRVDKRPRPRGGGGASYGPSAGGGATLGPNAGGGKLGARLTGDDAAVVFDELGSVYRGNGGKKPNAVDLWNFNYHRSRSGDVHSRSTNRFSVRHKYNKEEFLQANCQFIVKSSADYRQHVCNADILVDWNLIEQINISGSFECPICLYPPVAAKITRCGHVFCWSCMLHYLSLTDRTFRQCPICYEHVHKNDLKSAVLISQIHYKTNDMITFKLMKRQRGSLIVYNAADTIDESKAIFTLSEYKSADVYSKLIVADKRDVMTIIERERTQLEVALAEDESSPERCFIEEAVQILKLREEELKGDGDLVEVADEKSREEMGKTNEVAVVKELLREEDEGRSAMECVDLGTSMVKDEKGSLVKNGKIPSKIFYFYQASDGQHIYIHPVNARMLEHTYGSLEFAPLEITGRILEKEEIVMTEDMRNRMRYLQHLPLTCHFVRAEIQLKCPIVSKETIKHFQGELENRKRERKQKAREEKRSEQLWVEAENRMMGKIPEAKLCLTSPEEFPEFSEAMQIIAAEAATSPRNSFSESYSSTPPDTGSLLSAPASLEREYAGPSFAKMLSTAKKPSTSQQQWPELKADNNPEEVRLINVTGAKHLSSFKPKINKDSDTEPECEDYLPKPRCTDTFLADALSAAFEKASISTKDDGEVLQPGKKKKKNKQKLLYTTSRGGFL